MSAHTSWRYYELLFGEYGVDKGENTLGFANVDNEADARLIAAAPELLAVLKDMTDLAAGPPAGVSLQQKKDIVARARAAIAKAEGRE